MTKKDIFLILIKVFGLYVLIQVLKDIPALIILFQYNHFDPISFRISILTFILFVLIIYLLLYKTESLINLLRLNKDFDEKTLETTESHLKSIVLIGLTLLGFYFIIDSLPELITNLFYAFKNSISRSSLDELLNTINFQQNTDYYTLTHSFVKLLIGLILLMNKHIIAKLLLKKDSEQL